MEKSDVEKVILIANKFNYADLNEINIDTILNYEMMLGREEILLFFEECFKVLGVNPSKNFSIEKYFDRGWLFWFSAGEPLSISTAVKLISDNS